MFEIPRLHSSNLFHSLNFSSESLEIPNLAKLMWEIALKLQISGASTFWQAGGLYLPEEILFS